MSEPTKDELVARMIEHIQLLARAPGFQSRLFITRRLLRDLGRLLKVIDDE